jgi:hypothetical protein
MTQGGNPEVQHQVIVVDGVDGAAGWPLYLHRYVGLTAGVPQ